MSNSSEACREAAVSFTRLLADRAYGRAYAMTSEAYRAAVTLEQMKEDFESIVPLGCSRFSTLRSHGRPMTSR